MNPTVLTAAGLALLAFSSGVVILGKASRENHGTIYKIAGWFIIIASVMIIGGTMLHSAIQFYGWRDMRGNMGMSGRQMMRWMRNDNDNTLHRYYDDDQNYDMDENDYHDRGNYRYRRNRDYYQEGRNYNNTPDTASRMGR